MTQRENRNLVFSQPYGRWPVSPDLEVAELRDELFVVHCHTLLADVVKLTDAVQALVVFEYFYRALRSIGAPATRDHYLVVSN